MIKNNKTKIYINVKVTGECKVKEAILLIMGPGWEYKKPEKNEISPTLMSYIKEDLKREV